MKKKYIVSYQIIDNMICAKTSLGETIKFKNNSVNLQMIDNIVNGKNEKSKLFSFKKMNNILFTSVTLLMLSGVNPAFLVGFLLFTPLSVVSYYLAKNNNCFKINKNVKHSRVLDNKIVDSTKLDENGYEPVIYKKVTAEELKRFREEFLTPVFTIENKAKQNKKGGRNVC